MAEGDFEDITLEVDKEATKTAAGNTPDRVHYFVLTRHLAQQHAERWWTHFTEARKGRRQEGGTGSVPAINRMGLKAITVTCRPADFKAVYQGLKEDVLKANEAYRQALQESQRQEDDKRSLERKGQHNLNQLIEDSIAGLDE